MSDEHAEINELRLKIMHMDHAYWVLNQPIASDDDYDDAMQRLLELEKRNPELQDALSPTMRIGGQVAKGFQSVAHEHQMLSLDNAFGEGDLNDFFQRLSKSLAAKRD